MFTLLVQDLNKKRLILSTYMMGMFFLGLIDQKFSLIALVILFLFPMKILQSYCLESDICNINIFYSTLPIKRVNIVIEKYLLLITIIGMGLLAFVISTLFKFGVNQYIMALISLVPIMLFNECIYLINFFKTNAINANEKCKKFYMFIFIFIVVLGKATQNINNTNVLQFIYKLTLQELILVSLIATIIILVTSILKSISLYKYKDI